MASLPYRNQFSGGTVFILGNGKSLNNYDLSKLADKLTFCFNRFYLADVTWSPVFYTVADEAIIQDYGAEITRYVKRVAFPMFPKIHPSGVDFRNHVSDEYILWYRLNWGNMNWNGLKLFMDDPIFGINGTVASVGIQASIWMGFKTIYLLGVDMDYVVPAEDNNKNGRDIISSGDDPNHFTEKYFPEGHRYHYPRVDVMLEGLSYMNRVAKLHGIRIINLNPNSKFTDCEFADYNEVVNV